MTSDARTPLLAAAVAVAVATLAGCDGARSATGPTAAGTVNRAGTVRSPEAAQATAQTEFGLLAGGDYGDAWDLWAGASQQAIGRAEFVALGARCPRGVPMTATGTHLVDDDTVDVNWQRGGQTGTTRLVYTGGVWRYQPDQSTLDGYRQGRC